MVGTGHPSVPTTSSRAVLRRADRGSTVRAAPVAVRRWDEHPRRRLSGD